ncbi:MAG: hypothetical protein HC930_13215 [Hydrococcus sp. SU_1_0]|nr:hypothetical protein [Hydrococcus sp. SU_1_0]NJO98750.1 hypothetical protein [Pleurocapsa sp. CRU_1_2]
MVDKIAFQSIGGVEGIYLPSQEDSEYGTLITDYGVFPAEVSKRIIKKFPKITGQTISEANGETRLKYLTWLIGIESAPYYRLDLRSIHNEFPEWIKGDNWFYLQGIVAERTPDLVSLKMQRNYWQSYTEEEIISSINYLKIKNCPSQVRKSQFWKFAVRFTDGFLQCSTAERLADASTTKKIIKSWQTDPLHGSKYEELLKNQVV